MNTKNVFTAFDKNDEEILLYRKDSEHYFDLINNKLIPTENLNLSSLIQIKDLLQIKYYATKYIIKQKYKKENSILLPTNNLVMGYVCRMKNIKISGHYYDGYDYEWESKKMLISLFIKNNKKDNYICLLNNKEYDYKGSSNWDMYNKKNGDYYFVPDYDNDLPFISSYENKKDIRKLSYILNNRR